MLTEEDVTWLLENLPLELIQYIISCYNPECFLMLNKLTNYDWNKQCKLTFGFPHESSIYTYYNLCQNQKTMRFGCKRYETVVSDGNKIWYRNGTTELVKEDYKSDIVVCGSHHTVIMTTDRKLFSQGDNYYSQCGTDEYTSEFTQIYDCPDDIVQIGCGFDYTAILRSNGDVMISGRDYHSFISCKFRKMDLPNDIIRIACGSYHMFALRSDGTLMACGKNVYGQLGNNNDKSSYCAKFIEVDTPKDIIQVACGLTYTIIMRANGTLMSCGRNKNGQLGHGDYKNRRVFEEIKDLPNDITQIVCGSHHSFIVRKNGTLMSCGENDYGQLGRRVTHIKSILGIGIGGTSKFVEVKDVNNVAQIACGETHTVIMKLDGTLMGCGSDIQGQLGPGGKKYMRKFEKITVYSQ